KTTLDPGVLVPREPPEGTEDERPGLRESGLNLKPSARMHRPLSIEPEKDRNTVGTVNVPDPVFTCRDVNVFYSGNHALNNVSIDIGRKQVLAMIGPSGCGKSTFLRCLNRMNDTVPGARVTGAIQLEGADIHDKRLDVVQLRARVGMVFQKPNPFPKS